MAIKGTQKKLVTTRRPRVRLSYPLDFGWEGERELPFVLGVFADLAGEPETPLPRIAERKFIEIDIDNFDHVLAQIGPRLVISQEFRFRQMEDFSPEAIVRQVPALAALLERRQALNTLRAAMDECDRFAMLLEEVLHRPGQAIMSEALIVRALLAKVRLSSDELRQSL